MGRKLLGLATFLCLLLAWVPAIADESAKSIPNLVGTWTGEKTTYLQTGEVRTVDVFQITEQRDAHFRGTRTWGHSADQEPLGHAGGVHTNQAAEPILGMIGFDNKTIFIAEHDDWGHLHGQLVDPDTMEVVYMESGPHAAVFRVVWKRKR